jgi:hypothetical protein
MIRIYLDQKDWIRLLQCEKGHKAGRGYEDALVLLRAGVVSGRISLLLSNVHYIETARRRPYAKRVDLATLMFELSRLHTIAPCWTLARAEVRVAVKEWFGSRVEPERPVPFGVGADHAFGHDTIDDMANSLVPKFGARPMGAREVFEWGALAGHPDNDEPIDNPVAQLDEKERGWVEDLERLRALRQPDGWTRGEKSKRVWNAQALIDSVDMLNDAFEEADIPAGRLIARGAEAMSAFLEDVPTLHADYELRRLREQTSSAAWTPNDLRDTSALGAAMVYADAVVTENQWVDLAARSGLAEHHGTRVVKDLNELSSVLLGAGWAG